MACVLILTERVGAMSQVEQAWEDARKQLQHAWQRFEYAEGQDEVDRSILEIQLAERRLAEILKTARREGRSVRAPLLP